MHDKTINAYEICRSPAGHVGTRMPVVTKVNFMGVIFGSDQ